MDQSVYEHLFLLKQYETWKIVVSHKSIIVVSVSKLITLVNTWTEIIIIDGNK